MTLPVDPPSITCPKCGMKSYNPNDVREGYCGNCHEYTSPKGSKGKSWTTIAKKLLPNGDGTVQVSAGQHTSGRDVIVLETFDALGAPEGDVSIDLADLFELVSAVQEAAEPKQLVLFDQDEHA